VRKLNRRAASLMKDHDADAAEVQPGADKPSGSQALRDWIVGEAWGHHASGTCRIGIDPWRERTSDLRDEGAVIDSHFRVHGVRGLRVVDASVFPKIPGYFLAVPIYMISEKAAETIFNELSF
jgi:choline dehydrogenase-like flavoprotein